MGILADANKDLLCSVLRCIGKPVQIECTVKVKTVWVQLSLLRKCSDGGQTVGKVDSVVFKHFLAAFPDERIFAQIGKQHLRQLGNLIHIDNVRSLVNNGTARIGRVINNGAVRVVGVCDAMLTQKVWQSIDCSGKHDNKAGSHIAAFQPTARFSLARIVCGFLIIFVRNLVHRFKKSSCVHTNTSLSIKYFFIFRRIRASRTDTFFSDKPTRFAISA